MTTGISESSGLDRLARRLRTAWGKTRPIPTPRYIPGTPIVGSGHPLDPLFPPTGLTLGTAAMSKEAASCVIALRDKLSQTEENLAQKTVYEWGEGKFGRHWRYADLHTGLWAAATLIKPTSYLEIGVCRGRSVAIVGGIRPECDIYGFDLWIPNYGGDVNPGPDFVQAELRSVGHTGNVTLVSGDSRTTVPDFLRQHPDLYFDVITIDGDKSVLGVASDYANALPRLKVGGVVVTDDLPLLPILRRVWDKMVGRSFRFVTWEFVDAGFGVSMGIRVAD